MKKLLYLFLSIFIISLNCNASDVEIIPTISTKSSVQNKVWSGSLAAAWNELMDKISYGNIKFPEGTPDFVNELNNKEFSSDNINNKYYYQYVGKITKNTQRDIQKNLSKKFNVSTTFADNVVLSPVHNSYLLFTVLKRNILINGAENLGIHSFRGVDTEFFGINGCSSGMSCQNYEVLFYNSSDDFAIKLPTDSDDVVYLYKTSNMKPFRMLYKDMMNKRYLYEGEHQFTPLDSVMVPYIKFNTEKSYDELDGKRIKATNSTIYRAVESVILSMENQPVQQYNISDNDKSFDSVEEQIKPQEPRNLNFDDTFVLFLQDKNKKLPYLSVRVHDIEAFN